MFLFRKKYLIIQKLFVHYSLDNKNEQTDILWYKIVSTRLSQEHNWCNIGATERSLYWMFVYVLDIVFICVVSNC